jgi:hypothetical protein
MRPFSGPVSFRPMAHLVRKKVPHEFGTPHTDCKKFLLRAASIESKDSIKEFRPLRSSLTFHYLYQSCQNLWLFQSQQIQYQLQRHNPLQIQFRNLGTPNRPQLQSLETLTLPQLLQPPNRKISNLTRPPCVNAPAAI